MTAMRQSPEEHRKRLRESGLRATSARVAVLNALVSAKRPLSHAEVCDLVADGGFDRATVYRNLIDLVEVGVANRTDIGDHVWRFELVDGRSAQETEGHPHFVCTDCGAVSCLPNGTVAVKAVRGAPRSLRKSANVEVHVRGLCDACD